MYKKQNKLSQINDNIGSNSEHFNIYDYIKNNLIFDKNNKYTENLSKQVT